MCFLFVTSPGCVRCAEEWAKHGGVDPANDQHVYEHEDAATLLGPEERNVYVPSGAKDMDMMAPVPEMPRYPDGHGDMDDAERWDRQEEQRTRSEETDGQIGSGYNGEG